MSDKKKHQLGMNPSTASHKLVKDILWKLIVQTKQHLCYKCQKEMTRETFSIEHKEPWLDSENPVDNFFNLDNIAFSHLSCNIKSARRPRYTIEECGTVAVYQKGCRCDMCKKAKSEYRKPFYTKEKRRETYLRLDK